MQISEWSVSEEEMAQFLGILLPSIHNSLSKRDTISGKIKILEPKIYLKK